MKSIQVLDVTLRDGGCVNDFNFGIDYMNKILAALENSGVDYIELGYIDSNKGSEQERTQFVNEKVIYENFLHGKKEGITYVAMVDYGKFDVEKLESRKAESIDGIRMAFHKKNWKEALEVGRAVINKGYMFYVQPMLTAWYSDMELLELITCVNELLPDATGFYIVDSFGEMRGTDVIRLMHLVDNNLNPNIMLGFHSHNNLQLSYSNAMEFLDFPTERNIILDASVMGMGKGAGNLNTELLMEHLNLYYDKKYSLYPLLELIDQVINVIHSEKYWGYAAEYYLSSVYHCTPSYASHFYNKHMLPINEVAELLAQIPDEKKISFDKHFAEDLYVNYNSQKTFDDAMVIEQLKKIFAGKRVLVIAPGRSISSATEKIERYLLEESVITISLNNFSFETDYILTTRNEVYEEAIKKNRNIIVPSRITRESSNHVLVIDYMRWIITGEKTFDSSGVIALKLLSTIGVAEIMLAGFDGFSFNMNDNYYNPTLRRPITEEQVLARNAFYADLINEISERVNVNFITPSSYTREYKR